VKLLERRFLRGPNLYARTPCLLAVVDAGEGGFDNAQALQRCFSDVCREAGVSGPPTCIRPDPGSPNRFRVVFGYNDEDAAAAALDLAVDFINHKAKSFHEMTAQVRAAAKGRCSVALSPRVPVVAVTGTNGKTTTTLLIAHAARLAGRTTASTTTQGVFIDGHAVSKGDCTGYWSAREALDNPVVEFAVLETARGGILKRGLGFQHCDVAVMLNVSADHLGLDGVETVEDLAEVKGIVVGTARKAAVLNAEDRHCVAAAARLAQGVEVIYFSLDPDHPVLLRHLEQGGGAAYLHDGTVVVAGGARHEEVLRAEHMPVTLCGRAAYNTANCLAAAAALMASGFSTAEIARGLATFVSDGRTNPLRANVFDVRGITVIVDYAHNPAAYAAMAGMARALARGRLVGIITAPGDRRDIELEDIGKVCAERFDDIIVYESSSRGRGMGGTVAVIVRGARQSNGKAGIHEEWRDIDAIRHGIRMCVPGDVLVFSCGTSLDTLVEALRLPDPESAARIAAELS
jgi:cyanophycin synthetase